MGLDSLLEAVNSFWAGAIWGSRQCGPYLSLPSAPMTMGLLTSSQLNHGSMGQTVAPAILVDEEWRLH